LRASDYKMPID